MGGHDANVSLDDSVCAGVKIGGTPRAVGFVAAADILMGDSGAGAAASANGEVAAVAVSAALAGLPEGIQAFMGQQGFEQPTDIQRRSVACLHSYFKSCGHAVFEYPSTFLTCVPEFRSKTTLQCSISSYSVRDHPQQQIKTPEEREVNETLSW